MAFKRITKKYSSKLEVAKELNTLIKEQKLAPTSVGREIAGDPNFTKRLNDPSKSISTDTLDSVWRFILERRGQKTLKLNFKK